MFKLFYSKMLYRNRHHAARFGGDIYLGKRGMVLILKLHDEYGQNEYVKIEEEFEGRLRVRKITIFQL